MVGPKARVGGRILGQLLVEVIEVPAGTEVPAGDLGLVLVQGLVVDIEVLARVLEVGLRVAAPQPRMTDLRVVVVRA